jgi:hypothetical protein
MSRSQAGGRAIGPRTRTSPFEGERGPWIGVASWSGYSPGHPVLLWALRAVAMILRLEDGRAGREWPSAADSFGRALWMLASEGIAQRGALFACFAPVETCAICSTLRARGAMQFA